MRWRRIVSYLLTALGATVLAGLTGLVCWLLESPWPALIVLLPLAGALLAVALRVRLRAVGRTPGIGGLVPGAVLAGAACGAAGALYGMERSLLRIDPDTVCPLAFNDPAMVMWATLTGSLVAMLVSVVGAAGRASRIVRWYTWVCPLVSVLALMAGTSAGDSTYDPGSHSFVGLPAGTLLTGVGASVVLLIVAARRPGQTQVTRKPDVAAE